MAVYYPKRAYGPYCQLNSILNYDIHIAEVGFALQQPCE